MENEIDDVSISTDEEVIEPKVTPEYGLPEEPDDSPEDTDDIEALKQKNQELYEQMKKAKGFKRDSKTGKWVKPETVIPKPEIKFADDMTKEELYSLVKANVPDEDVSEVKAYARSHFTTCTEALKKPEVKAILKIRDEFRKSAETANTGASGFRASKISDDTLLANAKEGKMPTDDEGIIRLMKLRGKAK